MDKIFIAKGVAERLYATENAVDVAIAQTSQLLGEMMTARQSLNFAATVGNTAASKVAEAITALSEARTAMVEAHADLAGVQERMGVRTRSSADKQEGNPIVPSGELRRAG